MVMPFLGAPGCLDRRDFFLLSACPACGTVPTRGDSHDGMTQEVVGKIDNELSLGRPPSCGEKGPNAIPDVTKSSAEE